MAFCVASLFWIENTSASSVTLAADLLANGSISVTSLDTAAAGDDLTVNAGVMVTSTTSSVVFQSGDNMLINATSTVAAGTTISFTIDFGDADPGTGAVLDMLGDVDAASLTVLGGPDSDIFNISLDDDTPITVDGGLPSLFPGDTLNILTPGAILTPTGVGEGTISAPGFQTLTFTGIESVSGTVPEPSAAMLLLLGATGLCFRRNQRP